MLTALLVFASVILLDVLLSGDNAVVVAMAANTLPEVDRGRAILCGMILAAIARICFSLFTVSLLHYRFISIIGGIGLLWVAFRLGRDVLKHKDREPGAVHQGKDFLTAIGLIAVADISMSLDNVLAVAGIARNNPVMLVFGLVVSIACVGFGAKIVSGLLERWKWLNWAGVALIAVVALELVFGVHGV